MNHFLRKAKKSEFAKNTLTIFSGNVIAQAIPFLAEPVLARLYAPADFAVLAVYLSVANLFSIIATGRYELAIMLPKTDKKAIHVFALSFIISLVVSVVAFLVVWIFNSQICRILTNHDVSNYLYLVPLSVLSVAWYQTFNYWNSRKKRFRNVTYSKTTQSITNVGITLSFSSLKSLGLILGQILGQFLGIFPLMISFFRKDRALLKEIRRHEIKAVAVEYQNFPKINSLQAFCDVLRQSGEVFILSYFYVREKVGLHSRTLRLLFAPSSIIGSAIGQVFYQKASELYQNGGDLKQLVKKTVTSLAVIAIPFFMIIALFGDDLFAWFLGEPWRQAGEYGRLLTPWLFMSFITTPVSQIPLIVDRQKTAFMMSLCGHTLYLLAVVIGGLYGNILLGFALLSCFQFIYYIFLIRWLIKVSGTKKTVEHE